MTGTTYTAMAVASPSNKGTIGQVYRVTDSTVEALEIVPLTLSSRNAIFEFTVVENPTPPDAEIAVTLLTLGNYNSNRTPESVSLSALCQTQNSADTPDPTLNTIPGSYVSRSDPMSGPFS